MSKVSGFGTNDCLFLPSLGWKRFNSRNLKDDEPTYTYTDQNKRQFVGQRIISTKVGAFNQ